MSLMTLTHKIPGAPLVISPREGEIVDMDAVLIAWEPVTNPAGIEIDTYQLQLFPADPPEEQDPNDLNIDFTSEVPPTVTEVKIPPEFLMPGVEYEFEILAIETSENSTITVGTFVTAKSVP